MHEQLYIVVHTSDNGDGTSTVLYLKEDGMLSLDIDDSVLYKIPEATREIAENSLDVNCVKIEGAREGIINGKPVILLSRHDNYDLTMTLAMQSLEEI